MLPRCHIDSHLPGFMRSDLFVGAEGRLTGANKALKGDETTVGKSATVTGGGVGKTQLQTSLRYGQYFDGGVFCDSASPNADAASCESATRCGECRKAPHAASTSMPLDEQVTTCTHSTWQSPTAFADL